MKAKTFQHCIGVVGAQSSDEIEKLIRNLNPSRGTVPRLQVNIPVGLRTIYGGHAKEDWEKPLLEREELEKIFIPRQPGLSQVIQYTNRHKGGGNLFRDLDQVTKWAGPNMNGIQLNVPWADTAQLRMYRDQHPDIEITLRVSNSCVEHCKGRMGNVYCEIEKYEDLADCILFDLAGGRDHQLDPVSTLKNLDFIDANSAFTGSVAGGLQPETLYLLNDIWEKYPNTGTLAHRWLHRKGNIMRPIDPDKRDYYLKKSFAMNEAYQRSLLQT